MLSLGKYIFVGVGVWAKECLVVWDGELDLSWIFLMLMEDKESRSRRR